MKKKTSSAAQRRPRRTEAAPDESKPTGAGALRHAARVALQKNAPGLTNAMVKSGKRGNVQPVKLLYSLAEFDEDREKGQEAHNFGYSFADEWEADKKWIAEMRTEARKTAEDKHKPE